MCPYLESDTSDYRWVSLHKCLIAYIQSHKNNLNNILLSLGVAQILNRLDRKTFNDADQRLFEVWLYSNIWCWNKNDQSVFYKWIRGLHIYLQYSCFHKSYAWVIFISDVPHRHLLFSVVWALTTQWCTTKWKRLGPSSLWL